MAYGLSFFSVEMEVFQLLGIAILSVLIVDFGARYIVYLVEAQVKLAIV